MINVMLVDDDEPVLEFLSEAIPWASLSMQVSGAWENGSIALERALECMPDIVLTDINMPIMAGLELTRRLKELEPAVRIVILSCLDEFKYAQQAVKLGFIPHSRRTAPL